MSLSNTRFHFWLITNSCLFIMSYLFTISCLFTFKYRIRSYTAPLLNTTSAFSKVLFLEFFLNWTPFFGQKVPFLRDFLNWTSPKNQYWKIEPCGCKRMDTVCKLLDDVHDLHQCLIFAKHNLGISITVTYFIIFQVFWNFDLPKDHEQIHKTDNSLK